MGPSNMGVSNRGTPKSSILIGCSIINHPFRGTPIFGKHPYSSYLSNIAIFHLVLGERVFFLRPRMTFSLFFSFTNLSFGEFKNLLLLMGKHPATQLIWLISKNFPTDPWSIPQTPNQQFMVRNSFHLGVKGDVWGMLQGYVGVPLD